MHFSNDEFEHIQVKNLQNWAAYPVMPNFEFGSDQIRPVRDP